MYLNNNWYDGLKKVAQYVLPALAVLYFALSSVWELPKTEEVLGTIVAFEVFIGAILGVSNLQYKNERMSEGDSPLNQKGDDSDEPASGFLIFKPEIYSLLKWVTLFVLPAVGTLYFTLSLLWGLPYGEQVVASVASLAAFMGTMLGISSKNLKKSSIS